jgi:hypothetical protein
MARSIKAIYRLSVAHAKAASIQEAENNSQFSPLTFWTPRQFLPDQPRNARR